MRALCIVVLLALAVPVFAADSGDLVFPADMRGKERVSFIYENVKRGLDLDSGLALGDADFEADVLLLRFHTMAGEYVYFDVDLGAIDPSGGYSFYGGAGLRYQVYDSEEWRVGAFGQVHYAPDTSAKKGAAELTYDLLEAEAGVLAGRKWLMNEQLTVVPYIGPVVSILRLDGDVDANEDSPVGVALGAALQMREFNSFRLELRYFDDLSVSVSGTIAF